jgi:hypothetical protein
MKVGLRDNQDFWAGVMLVAIGGVAMLIARSYPFGTSLRMGPGYFPIGGILALFGLYFLAKSFRSTERIEAGWSLRALVVVPLALVMFGVLMTYAGFVPALVVLIFGSALASKLTLGCLLVFIWGLGLPYQLFVDF